MDPMRRVNLSNDTWFCNTPVEVLKIERESQRTALQQWLAEFHPTEDAKYPGRSNAVHRYSQGAQSGYDHLMADIQSDICCHVALFDGRNNLVSGTDGAGCHLVASAAKLTEGPSATQATVGYSVAEVGGLVADTGPAAAATKKAQQAGPAWWETDEHLARAVRQMLQPSYASANPLTPSTTGWCGSNGKSRSESNSSTGVMDRASYSATLGVYDGLIADNAVKAAELGQMMATLPNNSLNEKRTHPASTHGRSRSSLNISADGLQGSLQTPEQRHAAWVAELATRTVGQRQHQILLEAAQTARVTAVRG